MQHLTTIPAELSKARGHLAMAEAAMGRICKPLGINDDAVLAQRARLLLVVDGEARGRPDVSIDVDALARHLNAFGRVCLALLCLLQLDLHALICLPR